MIVKSDLTGMNYDDRDVVFYRNIVQSIFYMEHGEIPIDIFVDGRHKLVFVFTRDSHSRLIQSWIDNKVDAGNEQ